MPRTFEDDYEELFGKKLKFDPLDPNAGDGELPSPRLDLRGELNREAGTPAPDEFQSKLDELYKSFSGPAPAKQEPNGFGEDTARMLAAGTVQTGEMAAGGLEYGARRARQAVGDGVAGEVLDDVSQGLADLRRSLGQESQSILEGLSPEAKDALQRQVLSLDPGKSIWRGNPGEVVDRLGLLVSQSLPATIITLLPAARWFRAGMSPAALTYLGASEGGLSLGGIANSIANEIENMTPEQLQQESPRYAELLSSGMDPNQAREQLITEAQGNAPLIGGLTVGAISATAGRYLEPVFEGGANLLSRTGRGFASEALQEGPQSAAEQYAQNVAAQMYDQHRDAWEGVPEQAAQGAVVGGLSGAGFSAVLGGGPRETPEGAPEGEDTGVPPSRAPSSFQQVFGEREASFPQVFGEATPQSHIEVLNDAIAGYVSPEQRAALELKGEPLPQQEPNPNQGELYLGGPTDFMGAMQQREIQYGPPDEPPGPSQPPLRRRTPIPGGMMLDEMNVEPPPAPVQDYSPDMSTPPGVNPDPRQQDLLNPSPQGVPDRPSAEPVQDIMAQLDEMDRPEATNREAVYLSADNIAQLQQSGELDAILERGVPLANFDGNGGLLIARDRQVADSLVQLRNEGGDMQEILGTATGAGVGKPMGEGIVVQRQQNGAVVQESIVPDEAAADALSQEWENKYPNDEIAVMTTQAALGRRRRLLQQEQQKRVSRALDAERQQDIERTSQRVRQATAITPTEKGTPALLGSQATARRVSEGATSPTKAAARLLGQATRESAKVEGNEKRGIPGQRIGGFYPPSALDFADEREATRYANRFSELTDKELELELADKQIEEISNREMSGRAKESYQDRKARLREFNNQKAADLAPLKKQRDLAEARKEQLLDELAEIRTRAKPVRRAAHLVAAARRIAPEAVDKVVGKIAAANKTEDQEERPDERHESFTREEESPDYSIQPDELRALSDKDIESMKGGDLESLFKRAATFLAGRVQDTHQVNVGTDLSEEAVKSVANAVNRYVSGFWNPNAEGARSFIPPGMKEPRKPRKVRALDAFREMEKRYRSDSLKRKLIRRARDLAAAREHGGATKSKPLTATSTQLKNRPDIHRRKGKFNTQVLAAEFAPQDESRADKLKRKAQAQRARERLEKTVRRSQGHLEKLSSGKYEEMAKERLGEELTDRAQSMIYGRAYFRVLTEFGQAMIRSGNTGSEITAEMEKLNEFLNNAIKMPVDDFARVMGNLLHAESQTQIVEAKTDQMKELADPETRDAANASILADLLAQQARMYRLEELWRKNPYYKSMVEPLIHKFSDSVLRDGYPSYRPTEDELKKLQWVLDNWKIPRLRKDWYTPIRRYFTSLGFEWTPTKKVKGELVGGSLIIPRNSEGAYEYHPSDKALRPLYVKKHGATEHEGMGVSFYTEPKYQAAREKRGITQLEQLGRYAQANRVIQKFRDLIAKPKTTIAGFIRLEQRLIRAFKELDMWNQTSPTMGTIGFPEAKSYRMVGPRLESKELGKEEARALLLRQIKPQKIASEWYNDARVQAAGERPLKAEYESFLERVADPGPDIEQFRKTALKISEILDDSAHIHTLGEMFDVLMEGLPEGHMFHNLVSKLREAGVGDTPISWDYRGQLKEKQLGSAKWEDDPSSPTGRLRYILLNRGNIFGKKEPGARLLHVLLHEATHIATSGALDRNVQVRQAFTTLKLLAARFLHNEGGLAWEELPYGLREEHDIDEFVAEAFANPRFQAMLKRIRFDYSKSLWERFTDIVKNILGIATDRPEPKNAFEAVMTLENHIFTGQDRVFGGVAAARSQELSMLDETVRPAAEKVLESIGNVSESLKRGWARGVTPNAPLIMMTMRQIHKEFRQHFGVGKNPIDHYMENWERRNAENSRLMEQGEAVSREWSAATEKTTPADALEFSRIITEATLDGVHPDRSLSAPANKHITLDAAKAHHAELAARFNKLPAVWKDLYARVQNYYTKTLEQETNLLMLNALRGTLASGDNAVMSRSDFDKRYTEDTIREKQLYTKEGLEKEFGTLDKAMVRTLQEIASIPQKREGPYFPLMRYGNYVVYARKLLETKQFDNSKAAYEYRAKKLAEDPTLDVGVRHDENGFSVIVHDVDFRTRETITEAEQQRDDMIAKYGREAVTDVQLKDNFKAEDTIQSGSALAGILANLKGNAAAQNAIKNYWLRSLADKSFRKHQIRRKNRKGVDFDLQHRSFTNYVKQASYHISQLKFGWRMADAFREIREFVRKSRDTENISSVRLGQVMKELEKRDEMTNNATEIPKAFRTATELGQLFMLFGPSYWLINATQPYMVTMPWLGARYGWSGAGAALKNAQGMILHPLLKATKDSIGGVRAYFSKVSAEKAFNVLDQVKETIKQRGGERASAYIDMLEQLRQQSVIDLSWIAELRDISEGRSTSAYQRFMDSTRVMAHLTEVNNRIVTALAAYDLRYNEVMARQGATHELAHGAAVQTAKDAVAETQFDYSSANKARLFSPGGPLGKGAPLVFQFMQYSQHMYAMLISNFAAAVRKGGMDREVAAKTLAGVLTTHAIAGGVLGVALQPVKWAIGLLLMMLGDDDKPYTFANAASGESFDRWTREGLSWALGNKMGSVVAQGVPELAGVRLTDRMSLGTVYFLDLKTDTAESTIGSVVQGLLGPVVGYGFTGVRAGQYMLQGEYERALEALSPKAVRDVMRTVRFANEGLVNNTGDTVIDASKLSPWQLFMQSMGFRPSEIADFYSKQAVVKETEQQAKDNRDSLLARFRKASSIDERNAVLRDAAEFSQRNPAFAITRSALLRALTGKAEREQSYRSYGANLRGRSRLYADEADYYDTETE